MSGNNFNKIILDTPYISYTLHALEKHAHSQQTDCFRAIRERMEEKFKLEKRDPRTPPSQD